MRSLQARQGWRLKPIAVSWFLSGLLLFCGYALPPCLHAANRAPFRPPPPDPSYFLAQKYGVASAKVKPTPITNAKGEAPKPPQPLPKLLDGCTILVKGSTCAIVPTASILFHGSRCSITLAKEMPKQKKVISSGDFFKSCPNDVLVLSGVSTGISKVEVNGSFSRDEVKMVVVVDEKGVPACIVKLK